MWMQSPGHRENLLRTTFRSVGLGVARGAWQRSHGALRDRRFRLLTRTGREVHPPEGVCPLKESAIRPDNGLCMSDFQVKRIILPSGKAVEIVYLQSAPGATVSNDETLVAAALELCPECDGELVHPLAWHELSPGRWEIERRCPECEWEATGVHGEADVQRYDALLNEGTDALIEHVEQLAHDNMAAEIERFVAALRDDHITPFDF